MAMKADTIFYNGYIYNTPFKKFFKGYFSVKGENKDQASARQQLIRNKLAEKVVG